MKKKSARPSKKELTKTKARKKAFLFWQRGGIAQTALLVIVLVGAFYMVGGFFPSNFLDQTQTPFDGVHDNVATGSAEESLQLGTIPFKKCSEIVTMDLLLDLSDSMNSRTSSGATKLTKLKEAVLTLTNKLSDESIIGIQTFRSAGTSGNLTSVLNNPVPISYYKDVRENLARTVTGLSADGATPTYAALSYSLEQLKEGQAKYPDREFNFILISDGAPCPGFGCQSLGQNQDPRVYSPNPADEIKALGVNVYTVGIYAGNPFGLGGGEETDSELRELLVDIASSPENYYESKSGDDVASLLSQISNKICEGETGASGSAQ